MRNLTTADIAFLLCTSQRGVYRFTLSTDYGLILDIGAGGTITASLEKPEAISPLTPTGRLRSIAPPSPSCASPGGSIDAIMLTPTSCVAPGFPRSYPLQISTDVTNTTAGPKQPRKPTGPGYKYRIWPNTRSSSYMWYVPKWAGNPLRSPTTSTTTTIPPKPVQEKHVREEDLEARYSADWFEAYLDWVERSQQAVETKRRSSRDQPPAPRHGGLEGNPFADEGERTLWMVEGILLASWLCLQTDVSGVEYQPTGAEIYKIEKGNVGRAIQTFLSTVRA
ncbi:hypothetical protein B0H66DRAFT_569370 [Apodospora peruviana]|uniref:Uncharacterized protein n=1 Tax=Apodospora peruviana TaxID=516989 RepID=A0AAE0LZ55_9PEZI|nr:hypothetical protein B0H66DRAFT_569370 [Apodospora peruviana]